MNTKLIRKNQLFFIKLYSLSEFGYKVKNIEALKESTKDSLIFPPIAFMLNPIMLEKYLSKIEVKK